MQGVVLVLAAQHVDGSFQLLLSPYEWIMVVDVVIDTRDKSSNVEGSLTLRRPKHIVHLVARLTIFKVIIIKGGKHLMVAGVDSHIAMFLHNESTRQQVLSLDGEID